MPYADIYFIILKGITKYIYSQNVKSKQKNYFHALSQQKKKKITRKM